MTASKAFSLGKTERLKSRKQIDLLFESGKKISLFPFRLLYHFEPQGRELKAGFTVSSKNFPRAVDRNRIKRLCRESYRLQKTELESDLFQTKGRLYLFFIYTEKKILGYQDISGRLKQLLDKLIRVLHEIHPENT
jgi:ribonuclease P protein component